LLAIDAVLVAQRDERVGESLALSGCVDLRGDGGEGVPAPIWVVVGDRFLEALQVGSDELGQLDEQRDIEGR